MSKADTETWFFVINNSDGATYIRQLSEAELVAALNPDEDGYVDLDFSRALVSFSGIKRDTNYWGDGFLIIKGEIVVPEAKQVVTQIAIPKGKGG